MGIIVDDILSLKDVATLCGTSSSNVSNWRARDAKFPLPFQETAAGPLWKSGDIVEYMNKKVEGEYDVIAVGNLKKKTVAITGRAKGGKSFFSSRMVKDKTGFVKLFSSNSNDKTACPVYVNISEYCQYETFVFHSDFNSKYKAEDEDGDVQEVRKRVSLLVDQILYQEDVEKMREIEETVWMMKEVEKRYKGREQTNTYIETHQRPSEFATRLLRKCKLGTLEIIDTPGVSGRVDASRIAKSDIYFFLLKSDNSDEAQTIRSIVAELKADIATRKAVFLYKKEGFLLTQKKYDEARKSVKRDMKVYNELFKDLQGGIISTDLDICDPAGHCIVFPTMDVDEMTFPEEEFLKDIGQKMEEAFLPDTEDRYDQQYQNIVDQKPDAVKNFVLEMMRGIPKHEVGTSDKQYTTDDVLAGKHDRVMTNDGYRFHTDLKIAYQEEANLLNDFFTKFKVGDYSEEWQQIVIKYLYRKLTNSIRSDRGLGVGIHPWEEKPARTMLVEESIFADKVLDAVSDADKGSLNILYRKVLQNNNITSATWNCVGCTDDIEALKKLSIIRNDLLGVKVSNRKEMVLCRYVGGLRKVAEYKILLKTGIPEDKAMELVHSLPF